jgi:hypothetical protein
MSKKNANTYYYFLLIVISGIIYKIESNIIEEKIKSYNNSFEIGYLQYLEVEIRNQTKCDKSLCFCIYEQIDNMLPLCSTFELYSEFYNRNHDFRKEYNFKNHQGFCVDGLCTNKTIALLVCQIDCQSYYNLSFIVDVNGELYETSLLFEKTIEDIKELKEFILKNRIFKNTLIITYTDLEGVIYRKIPPKEFKSNIILFSKLLFGFSMIKLGIQLGIQNGLQILKYIK